MNITSTTGYSEMRIYNNLERVFFILMIFVGDILFAIAFGMMTLDMNFIPEKFHYLFRNIM